MRLGSWLLTISILLAPQFASGAHSAGRENPFNPPTSEEQERAKQDERIRQVLIDATPEIEAKLMQSVASSLAAVEVRIKRRIDEISVNKPADAGLSGIPSRAMPGNAGGPASVANVKDGKGGVKTADNEREIAKFISCVNGKALYRDKDNTLFQVSGVGANGIDPCSR